MILPGIKGFVAPAAGGGGGSDPHWANVVLLVQGDGGSITDSSASAHTMSTVGVGTAISTASPKIGAGAIALPASGAQVRTPGNSDFTFGTSGDFTIEAMARLASLSTVKLLIGISSGGTGRYAIGTGTSDSSKFALWFQGSEVLASATGVLTGAGITSGFVHLAWTRASGTSRLFVNGTSVASAADTRNYAASDNFVIGEVNGGSGGLDRFDLWRVTKGVARYTSNFTAPSAPFPTS